MRGLWHRYGLCTTLVLWLWPWMLSADPKPTDGVAEVDDHRITVEALRKKLSEWGKNRPGMKWEELRQEAVNELINDHLVGLKARSIRLEEDSVFMLRADYLLSQVASRELFNRAVTSVVSVSDSEVVERYRQRPEDYQQREWVRASHILIAPFTDTLLLTSRQKETGWWADSEPKAKAIADSLHRLITAGASFDSLARHWSQDMASGVKGGDLGIFSRGQMVPEFDSAAFALDSGAVSRPVRSKFGYHLIKVTGRQERKAAPFSDSLRQVIHAQMLNEKLSGRSREYLDSVQQAFGLAFNEKVLEVSDSALQARRIWAVVSSPGDTVWSDRLGAQLASARPITPRPIDREYKKDLLKEIITPLLLRRVVRETGITESEAYQARKEQLFRNEQVARIMKEASIEYRPTPDEIEAYFQQHKAEFVIADSLSVHVQQMVFKTRKEAERVLGELRAGADFALLARKYFPGDSDIAQEAFDLGFISPPAMPKDFFAVAETLTVGAAGGPVRTHWGYHLMRVLARRPDLNLEMARPKIVIAIRQAKQEEHKRKWEERLRKGHAISIKERVLKSIKIEPSTAGVSTRP